MLPLIESPLLIFSFRWEKRQRKHLIWISRTLYGPYSRHWHWSQDQNPKAFCLLRWSLNPVLMLHLVIKKKKSWFCFSCTGALLCQGRQEPDTVPGEPANTPDAELKVWGRQISCTFDIWMFLIWASFWRFWLSEKPVLDKIWSLEMFYPSQRSIKYRKFTRQ